MEHYSPHAKAQSALAVVALYALVVALISLSVSTWEGRQTWLLAATGAIVIWYTWETKLLRETAAHQVEIALRQRDATLEQIEVQIRPYVVIERGGNGFTLKNIGVAPALNVGVENIRLDVGNDIDLTFEPVFPVIPPGGVANVSVRGEVGGHRLSDFLAANIDPKYATRLYDVVIHYQNVEGRAYTVSHAIGPQLIRLGGIKTGRTN